LHNKNNNTLYKIKDIMCIHNRKRDGTLFGLQRQNFIQIRTYEQFHKQYRGFLTHNSKRDGMLIGFQRQNFTCVRTIQRTISWISVTKFHRFYRDKFSQVLQRQNFTCIPTNKHTTLYCIAPVDFLWRSLHLTILHQVETKKKM
jgi:hypothetical protein